MADGFDAHRLGVYVITSGTLVPGRGHREIAAWAVDGGATAVQLRAPELSDEAVLPLASGLAGVCREAGILFIVNDRLEVALDSGADGVHLGQDDAPALARRRLGGRRVLGISVEDPDQAREAYRAGADYVGATVWATPTKPDAVALGLQALTAIVQATPLPVVGIGGIDASNVRRVLRAGASGVAVISAVAATPDPAEATRQLRALVEDERAKGTA